MGEMFILKSRKWLYNNVWSKILFLVEIHMYKYSYICQKVGAVCQNVNTGYLLVKKIIGGFFDNFQVFCIDHILHYH